MPAAAEDSSVTKVRANQRIITALTDVAVIFTIDSNKIDEGDVNSMLNHIAARTDQFHFDIDRRRHGETST